MGMRMSLIFKDGRSEGDQGRRTKVEQNPRG